MMLIVIFLVDYHYSVGPIYTNTFSLTLMYTFPDNIVNTKESKERPYVKKIALKKELFIDNISFLTPTPLINAQNIDSIYPNTYIACRRFYFGIGFTHPSLVCPYA